MTRFATPLQVAAIMLCGLTAGAMFGIWQGYNPAAYSPAAFVEVHQGAVRGLNVLLPVQGILATVATVALAFLARRNRKALALYGMAAVLLIIAGLVTRFGNQPINEIVMGWGATPPAGWEVLRDSWWTWHLIRLAVGVAALVLLVAAVFTHRDAVQTVAAKALKPA